MKSDAATVEEYFAGLPEDRGQAIQAVRRVVLENLPDGYEECMAHGMIVWVVPLSRYPARTTGCPSSWRHSPRRNATWRST